MLAKNLKVVTGLLSVITISGALAPTVTVLAEENNQIKLTNEQTSTQETYVLNENNQNYNQAVKYLKENASSFSVKYFEAYFYGKTVTSKNRDELLNGYLEFLSTKPHSRVGIEVILGIIASAIAIIQGMYNVGRYAAKQCVSRGILSKKEYKPNGGWIMAGITASFGFPAALGFDDYMYNR
ncbi:hypothetical protein [Candidatus Enterococcus courvalinii]|uniref:Uncharacterized protein n=1 Tax=Candidatus Enterococcus courvalinii TaxID=2815329 RepID=A0ABS3HWG8_9ENTE|nr:hypothetical protein [Enterococcus sp. MSG2901]MBO0480815.1 hypothetical protein [Enterococcus sp. MSG2901]